MAIKMLFEDREITPSSVLLKHCVFGCNIYFAGGCHLVASKLNQIYNDGDSVFVFYDVSPNNRYTRKYYESLVQEVKAKYSTKDVYVVPIVCIEYYICKCFVRYNYMCESNSIVRDLVNAIVKDFEYNKVPVELLGVMKLSSSLEKLYKYIIDMQKLKCLINSFTYDKDQVTRVQSLKGMFYDKDCVCERRYCRINCMDTQRLKAERLYTSLPLFIVDTKEHISILNEYKIYTKNVDIEQIVDGIQNMYNHMCTNMGLSTFKVFI